MTTKTEGFQGDKLSTAGKESLEVQLLREAVTASMQVYDYRAKEREKPLRLEYNTTQTLRQFMMTQLRRWDKGEADRKEEKKDEVQGDQDTDGEGWDTASDGESWGEQEEEQDPENSDEVGEGWEQVES